MPRPAAVRGAALALAGTLRTPRAAAAPTMRSVLTTGVLAIKGLRPNPARSGTDHPRTRMTDAPLLCRRTPAGPLARHDTTRRTAAARGRAVAHRPRRHTAGCTATRAARKQS